MRSLELQAALTEFVEEAAGRLATALAAGAEVPLALEPHGVHARSSVQGGSSVLYAYRALTGEFIVARQGELERLPSHSRAARLLTSFPGLDRYLARVGTAPARGEGRMRVDAALLELLREVFDEQTDFVLRPERLRAALERLESAALAPAGETMLVATLHGLTIGSPELALTAGLTIAQPHALEGLPEGALFAEGHPGYEHLIVALAAGEEEPPEAIVRGRAVLKDLLRALRLFGDGRVTLGPLAWARVAGGTWVPFALGEGGRPHGMLVVSVEQEDELRAFCNLVSRRAPDGNELAWALRRFELGCGRESSFEALTDHLLALRALLEPEGPASGLLPGRLAALCATPERRSQLTERTVAALTLEREVVAGTATTHAGLEELAWEMADHLRALLRDVICGHLDTNLAGLADELLLAAAQEPGHTASATDPAVVAADAAPPPQESVEEMLSHASQSQEILDVFI
jgi:hypothetical protein